AAPDERAALLAVQLALSEEEFRAFKYLLEERIPRSRLEPAGRPELCSLLLQHCPGRALRLSAAVLRRIGRHDLVERFQLPAAPDGTERYPDGMERCPGGAERRPDGMERCPDRMERRLTERELMQVARLLGKEWQEVAICCLGLEKRRLEQIREDNPGNVVVQVFEGLREWQRRERHRATPAGLHARLAEASVDPEVLVLLRSLGSR
ncbi:CRADD protein, partial [Crypturellus undulatus]|nr:CRADD protein [Crypturellus undulatus]